MTRDPRLQPRYLAACQHPGDGSHPLRDPQPTLSLVRDPPGAKKRSVAHNRRENGRRFVVAQVRSSVPW